MGPTLARWRQTFTDIKVISVDDGSQGPHRPDRRAVRSPASSATHRGWSAAQNAEIEASGGELLLFLARTTYRSQRNLELQDANFDAKPADPRCARVARELPVGARHERSRGHLRSRALAGSKS